MESVDMERNAKAWVTGFFASLIIAAAVLGFWLLRAPVQGHSPRVDHLLFGAQRLSHSRYWDGLLGLYGFGFMLAVTMKRCHEPGDLAEDACMLVAGLIVGLLATHIAGIHGFTLASNDALIVAASAVAIVTALLVTTERFRMGMMLFLGVSLGLSLYVGVAAGTILSAFLAVVFGGVAIICFRIMRARVGGSDEIA